MNTAVHIFDDPSRMAESLASAFIAMAEAVIKKYKVFNIALSGGSTPGLFYQRLGTNYPNLPFWRNTHIFWGDERCVPPDDPDSNYHMAWKFLIKNIFIPEKNIHRIHGEEKPTSEAKRYCQEMLQLLPKTADGWPVFDWVLLGLGEDGHTASIFPGIQKQDNNSMACAVASHPTTGQQRITLTLPVINCARKVTFLVSGQSKAALVTSIIKREGQSMKFPAARVLPVNGEIEWYLDAEAGAQLRSTKS
jgi:6-phosphogluconolactonase